MKFYVAHTSIFLRSFQIYISETETMKKIQKWRKKNIQEKQIAFEACNSTVCHLLHVCMIEKVRRPATTNKQQLRWHEIKQDVSNEKLNRDYK